MSAVRDAPPGPWIVERPTGDSWLVTNPARESQQVYPYFGRFASEVEALTVRDALNGVRAAAPAPHSDAAFQRLWTKYAALPNYDKAEWTAAFNEIWGALPRLEAPREP